MYIWKCFTLSTRFDNCNSKHDCNDTVSFARADGDILASGGEISKDGIDAEITHCSNSKNGGKRTWEASLSSLKSKRVKGSHSVHCISDSSWDFVSEVDRTDSCFVGCSWGASRSRGKIPVELPCGDSLIVGENNIEKLKGGYLCPEALVNNELSSTYQCFRIMLMNIADDVKKTHLTKVCLVVALPEKFRLIYW